MSELAALRTGSATIPGYYDYNYSEPTVYSGRRYYGPPDVYQRRSYRKRNRDWD